MGSPPDAEIIDQWKDEPAPLLPLLHAFHDRDVAPEGATRAAVYDMSDEAYRAGIRKDMALPTSENSASVMGTKPQFSDQASLKISLSALNRSMRSKNPKSSIEL